jgi:hypothetical protein
LKCGKLTLTTQANTEKLQALTQTPPTTQTTSEVKRCLFTL